MFISKAALFCILVCLSSLVLLETKAQEDETVTTDFPGNETLSNETTTEPNGGGGEQETPTPSSGEETEAPPEVEPTSSDEETEAPPEVEPTPSDEETEAPPEVEPTSSDEETEAPPEVEPTSSDEETEAPPEVEPTSSEEEPEAPPGKEGPAGSPGVETTSAEETPTKASAEETTPDPYPDCQDEDPSCAGWSKAGYCSSNTYTIEHCRRSCKLCDMAPAPAGCHDSEPACIGWSRAGYCETNTYTKEHCKAACGTCDTEGAPGGQPTEATEEESEESKRHLKTLLRRAGERFKRATSGLRLEINQGPKTESQRCQLADFSHREANLIDIYQSGPPYQYASLDVYFGDDFQYTVDFDRSGHIEDYLGPVFDRDTVRFVFKDDEGNPGTTWECGVNSQRLTWD